MTIEITDQQSSAVARGEEVLLVSASIGNIVVLSESEYEELLGDAHARKELAHAGLKALDQWARENPF